ncbi:cyanophycin synthetase [Solimicrobium silvestre]|uniref:Cyanophycin synthetase n=1 Tax=Solimicrobium silvestre TaxID=2099400 RepID=A0A2S9GU38_9BURK|nr:cyanophycin synthetase [Solimicrobium silvestre]PRC91247.1 Cyanophycin synthetase [Solimicrobium silvestre]
MTNKKDIKFTRVTYLRGPNIWTYRPVIEAWVDIGDLENHPSNTLPGFNDRLIAWLPSLIEHRCGVGERGGFIERLHTGTWAAHVLEHIVLELQNLAGMRTGFGKTRKAAEPSLYKMAFRTRQEQVGRAALVAGRELLLAAIENTAYDVTAKVAELSSLVDSLCLGPSTAHIVDAATTRSIPWLRLNDGNLVQLGFGNKQRRIWTAETDQTSAIAESISSDKDLTKSLLKSCGVPVPEGSLVHSAEEAWEAAQDIGLPVVVKPYDGNHGRGVSLDLKNEADVIAAFKLADRKGDGSAVIVEQFIPGNEHRVLVVGKKVVAVAAGEAAWVTGDGKSNIIELVDSQINSDPRRGTTEEFPLNALGPQNGAEIILELERQGFTAYDIPTEGHRVLIQRNGNVAFDVTDQIHPSIAAIATLAARVVGLDVAGVDLVVEDISKPLNSQRGAVIEVNAGPGLLAHLKPASGLPRPIGTAIIDHLFPNDGSGRIPIIGVTEASGSTLIARLIAHLIHVSGKHVGLACSTGLYLDHRQIDSKNGINWDAGQRLLINRSIDAAVFETSHRMILSEGLVYDKCAVGVVSEITENLNTADLSEFYITDHDKLFNIVRTQIDVILPSGVAVLNAANPRIVEMAELCDGTVIFYGDNPTLAAIIKHRAEGERVVFLRDNTIVLANGEQETALLPLSSLKPTKAAQPANVMAAVAAAWALNISPELIEAGLRTFESNPKKTHY